MSGSLPVINLGSELQIPTYFLVISLAFCLTILWMVRRAQKLQISVTTALDLALVVMVSGFLGSRIFHILFEAPGYYAEDPLRALEFWMGGYVWYGGVIAGTVAGVGFLKWKKQPLLKWLDFAAPLCAFGYALGRASCLLTGCCYGGICTLPSGFSFRYPTQAFAVIWESALVFGLLALERSRERETAPGWLQATGQVFFIWAGLHALGRIIMEAFRADNRGPKPLGLSIAIWISFAILAISISVLKKNSKSR